MLSFLEAFHVKFDRVLILPFYCASTKTINSSFFHRLVLYLESYSASPLMAVRVEIKAEGTLTALC